MWTYDNAGNITSRKEYAYTTGTLGTVQSTVNYTYGNSNWKDLLTAYNGQSISYDGIGNPTSMLGWTYTWEHGRQLASMSSGGTTWSFDYNADGMRYRRSNGSTTYTYYYNGDMLRYLDINGTKLYFVLDADGKPIEVSYKPANSTTTSFYFYVHNLMGDVMAILDTSGNAVVKYTYDAWGNIISTTGSMASTLGTQNPFRYRSYVYDHETGLYYLQSRYYNPSVGRFINADAFVSTGQGILGNNMFAYCRNNPVIRKDASGTEDVTVEDCNQDNNPLNDLGNPTGGGVGGGNFTGSASTGTSTSQSDSVKSFLTNQGQNPDDILECFNGKPQLQVLTEDTTVFRVWGGTTPEYGHWVSPYNYGDAARSRLALPPGNSMTYVSSFVIPAGTTVLAGVAGPNFGQPGGGVQWWVACIEFR